MGLAPSNAVPRFFEFFDRNCLTLSYSNRCVVYVPVWKSANTAIRESLIAELPVYFNRTGPPRLIADKFPCKFVQTIESTHCKKGVFAFTFVREPLNHFISGYGEWMLYRRLKKVRAAQGDPPTPREFLDGVFNGSTDMGMKMSHMSPQSMAMDVFKRINFVGKLENIDTDWPRMLNETGIESSSFKSMPLRKVLHRVPAVRFDMHDLLLSERSHRHALCDLLRLDYECFGYDFGRCLGGSAIRTP